MANVGKYTIHGSYGIDTSSLKNQPPPGWILQWLPSQWWISEATRLPCQQPNTPKQLQGKLTLTLLGVIFVVKLSNQICFFSGKVGRECECVCVCVKFRVWKIQNFLSTLRIMGSQNRWFGDPRILVYTFKPLYRVQWFLGYVFVGLFLDV